jgi:hypothetical protein
MRYMPGAVAVVGSLALIGIAPKHRKVLMTGIATLLGLMCMEAEYWVAHGFPASEVWFFSVAGTVTLAALFAGGRGCLLLSVAGFAFFTLRQPAIRRSLSAGLHYARPLCVAHGLFTAGAELVWSRHSRHRTLGRGTPVPCPGSDFAAHHNIGCRKEMGLDFRNVLVRRSCAALAARLQPRAPVTARRSPFRP